jgi:hypothetical protein
MREGFDESDGFAVFQRGGGDVVVEEGGGRTHVITLS